MKKLLLYIQTGEIAEIQFGNPLKDLPHDYLIYELDNHSDQLSIHHATKQLELANHVVVVFQHHSAGQLGNLSGLISGLARKKDAALRAYSIGSSLLPSALQKKLDVKNVTSAELAEMLSGLVS